MKIKPVAWMIQKGKTKILFSEEPPNNLMQNFIPLYTHPSKHDLGIAEAIGFEKGYQAGLKKASEK